MTTRHISNSGTSDKFRWTYYSVICIVFFNSTSSSVGVTTELHEKHAHAYLVIAVLLSCQSTRLLLHGTKILVFTTIIFILANLCSSPATHHFQGSPSVSTFSFGICFLCLTLFPAGIDTAQWRTNRSKLLNLALLCLLRKVHRK